eukprot:CAMPEP_0172417814 /NCGR_PEP_ID=MMETSP1064-20121228/4307_1 /TAXON_ID=202472 /ORGANISM="Aulacoseira subarctica , Strain CCAP 1002/5" /LENGTH=129 /DNA_ID=CAMNT_0013156337 /DNA_START=478 /DNA_END=865 /DNA_ORIENTATION=-
MLSGQRQGMSLSAAEYTEALLAVASGVQIDSSSMQAIVGTTPKGHLNNYYGELYYHDPAQTYYGEGLSLEQLQSTGGVGESEASPMIRLDTANDYKGDTVGTTATYLSNILVQQVYGEGQVLEQMQSNS